MKLREDLTLSVRAMFGSPIESMLLIVGLALSIGATASGFAMFEKAQREGEDLLRLAEYREIVVSSRESREDMVSPIVVNETDDDIVLTIDDLEAQTISPDISYAYLANRTGIRLNTSTSFRPPDMAQTEQNIAVDGASGADEAAVESPAETSTDTSTDNATPAEGAAPSGPWNMEFATVEGPEPTVDELPGYKVTPEFFVAMGMNVSQGSVFTEQDLNKASNLMVLGADIAATLFEDGISMGRQLASFDKIYTIIGVLEPTETNYDVMAFIPSELASNSAGAQAARGPFGGNNATLHFTVSDATLLSGAESQLTSWFDSLYGEGLINISVPREEAEATIERNEKIAVITMVLALAGLLIASVNVSNILYSRTLRRRKQIGILKALGATRRDIFKLFFSEGALLLLVGAAFGLLIVEIFQMVLAAQTGSSNLKIYAILLGVIVSAIITLVFTLVPALQATKVPPAEAMRVE